MLRGCDQRSAPVTWVAENTDRDVLDALERMCVRRQRFCRSCETLHYASNLTPLICPICETEDVEVR